MTLVPFHAILIECSQMLCFRMSVNTAGGNWSSTEGSTCDTMSVALSEMPDPPSLSSLQATHPIFNSTGSNIIPNPSLPPSSPEHHRVNRKELMEQMGLPPAQLTSNHHSRIQPASRYVISIIMVMTYNPFPCTASLIEYLIFVGLWAAQENLHPIGQ